MNKISTVSNVIRATFVISMLLNIGVYASRFFMSAGESINIFGVQYSITMGAFPESLQASAFYWDTVLGLPSVILTTLLCLAFYRLFSNYASNEFFSYANSDIVNKIGILLIVQVIWGVASVPMLGYLVADTNNIIMNFSAVPFFQLVTGLIVLCIGWILKQATELQEAQALTI